MLLKKATITVWSILHLNPVYPDTHTHTHILYLLHTHREVKSTLLSCCWGANGLSLCITDPKLLLNLLSACFFLTLSISVLHLLTPLSLLCSFVSVPPSPTCPIICLFLLCSVYFSPSCFLPQPPSLTHTSWGMNNLVVLHSAILVHVR